MTEFLYVYIELKIKHFWCAKNINKYSTAILYIKHNYNRIPCIRPLCRLPSDSYLISASHIFSADHDFSAALVHSDSHVLCAIHPFAFTG